MSFLALLERDTQGPPVCALPPQSSGCGLSKPVTGLITCEQAHKETEDYRWLLDKTKKEGTGN